MLLKGFHSKLTENRYFTYLGAAADAAATTLTVADSDLAPAATSSNIWSDNDYMLVGEWGEETAEIMQVNGAVTSATSITVDREGSSGGTRYAHPIGTKVYRIDFNQIRFVHSTDTTSANIDNANLSTPNLVPSSLFTTFEDTVNTIGYGSYRFRNATTSGFSSYAAFVSYSGHTVKSLFKLREKVRKFLGNDETITNDEIDEELNDSVREVMHDRMWNFAKIERSLSTVANQVQYTIPSTINNIHTVTIDSQPLAYVDQARWDTFHWDATSTASRPTHFTTSGTILKTYPKVTASASTTTLGAAITTTTATSITVVASSAFRFSPYARFIIGSEVIYATGSTSTTFTGCLRGQEGTTAATHLISVTVTEQDIVLFGQIEPTNLLDTTDETTIPEPEGVAMKAAANLAIGKIGDKALADRLEIKYEKWIKGLRDRFSTIVKSQSAIVRDASEIITDQGMLRDPNRYPSQLDTTSGS